MSPFLTSYQNRSDFTDKFDNTSFEQEDEGMAVGNGIESDEYTMPEEDIAADDDSDYDDDYEYDTDGGVIDGISRKTVINIFDWLDVFFKAIVIVVLLFTVVFKIATIDGESMENTLFENEKVLISNLFYEPEQGDVVVVSRNYKNEYNALDRKYQPIIKRVIAVEGQTVDIDFVTGVVTVDGKKLDESYVKTPTNLSYDIKFPITVEKDHVFLLGDNRNSSLDSRSSEIGESGTGQVNKRYILGKAIFRIFPINKASRIK